MGRIGFDQIASVGTGNFKQSINKLNRIQLEHKAKATQSTIEDLQKLKIKREKRRKEVLLNENKRLECLRIMTKSIYFIGKIV